MTGPATDAELPGFVANLGLPGLIDLHVHFMPPRVQEAVWRHFDRLTNPRWPVTYRFGTAERLAILARLGVQRHTALAYAHRPGMAAWLNDFTLGLAAEHRAVIPSFTFYPEPGVEEYVAAALAAGGAIAKVHLQVGRFDPLDPRLAAVWPELARRRVPVIIHAGAVDDGSGGAEFCGVDKVARLLDRFPDLRLVIAHLGAPDYADFLALAESAPTVSLDTTMVFTEPALLGRFPAALVDRLAALGGRIVLGSDFPTIPYPYAEQVRGLAALGLGDDWLRGVLWHNPARLLGLAPDAPSGRA